MNLLSLTGCEFESYQSLGVQRFQGAMRVAIICNVVNPFMLPRNQHDISSFSAHGSNKRIFGIHVFVKKSSLLST